MENDINTGINLEKQNKEKTDFRPPESKINSGLDLEKQELDLISAPKQLMGAASDFPIIKADADWMDVWLQLTPETQFGAKLETMGCTGYGTSNILEMIWKWQYNMDINISDRALNKMSGTTKNGNSVDAPIDTIRNQGFLLEEEYPWDRNTFDWNEYYKTIPTHLLTKAKERLKEWDFKHEYISTYDKNGIIEALKTSPIGGTVAAWYKGADGLYHDYGYNVNHFTIVIVGYKLNEYWVCADSYPEDFNFSDNPQQPEFIKKLAWNYRFGSLKRYKIIAKANTSKKKLLSLILSKTFMKNLWSYSDSHGVYFYFVKKVDGVYYKQFLDISKLPEELKALKAIFIMFGEEGLSRQTSYGEISQIKDKVFF